MSVEADVRRSRNIELVARFEDRTDGYLDDGDNLPCRQFVDMIMYMEAVFPLADVRDRLSPIVSSVERTHERVVITKNGRPAAVLISYEDLESLEETLEILSDPEAVDAIRESLADPVRVDIEEIRRELEQRGGK